jgi:hypothetical protein
MAADFAIIGSLVRPGRPRYPVLVHQAAALLHASFRPRLTATPLRFANPSPPSGWIEDFHLQAVAQARHTKKRNSYREFRLPVGTKKVTSLWRLVVIYHAGAEFVKHGRGAIRERRIYTAGDRVAAAPAERPLRPPLPTSRCAAANRRSGPRPCAHRLGQQLPSGKAVARSLQRASRVEFASDRGRRCASSNGKCDTSWERRDRHARLKS